MARVTVSEPPITRFLFADTRTAPFWLLIRLYAGWQWFSAGTGKLGSPAWTGDKAGVAITGFVKGALEKVAGEHQPDPVRFCDVAGAGLAHCRVVGCGSLASALPGHAVGAGERFQKRPREIVEGRPVPLHRSSHQTVAPPSTGKITPVTKLASGEAR